jgi:predicted dehydrogenase
MPTDKLSYAMVGGAQDSFIGVVHRKAIALDGSAALVAGCFSRDPDKNRATGAALDLDPARVYSDYSAMAATEGARADRPDFIVITTRNDSHHEIAKAFLEQGFHIMCDKPLAVSVDQASELAVLAAAKGVLFGVTYTKTGYPLVKQAREMVKAGEIGEVRYVAGEYLQDYLAVAEAQAGDAKLPLWRVDPAQSGPSNCLGDIGTHLENIVMYVTGLKLAKVCARLDTFGAQGPLDDNATVLVEYQNGARGVFWSSQIAYGNDNALRFRIIGSLGALEWDQERPNELAHIPFDKPRQVISRGRDALHPAAQAFNRLPAGHPEGTYEAFANIYAAFAASIRARKEGREPTAVETDFTTVLDGLDGVVFVDRCLRSSRDGSVWVEF